MENIVTETPQKKILLITGSVGRGKTYLMRKMMAWANEQPRAYLFPVWKYVSRPGEEMDSLIYLFTAETFMDERGDAARAEVRSIAKAKLLFIDDLGGERNPPPTFESGLASLIEQRVDLGAHTVISTNLGEKRLQERYGDRNLSRIVGFSQPIELIGPDRRMT